MAGDKVGCGRDEREGGTDVEAGVVEEQAVKTTLRVSPTIKIRLSFSIGAFPFYNICAA